MRWINNLLAFFTKFLKPRKFVIDEVPGRSNSRFGKKENQDMNYEYLKWLADAPLFIDEAQINALHDATLRPDSEQEYVELAVTKELLCKLDLNAGVEGELGLPNFLTTFIPGLTAKAAVSGGVKGGVDSTTNDAKTIRLRAIHNPQRKLQELVLHYASNQADRLQFVSSSDLGKVNWREPKEIVKAPRMLVFLDLPSLDEEREDGSVSPTIIIPTAAEFSDGTIKQVYLDLQKHLLLDLHYPSRKEGQNIAGLREARKEYWQSFAKNFNDTKAMVAVEEAARGMGKLRWIDYRLRLSTEGDTLHLHCCPAERYDTGVFAYNLVKRGHKHGLRIVGTLKSEPDLNVLAIYEK